MLMNNFDKKMSYLILWWEVMLFSNSRNLSKNYSILPYRIHFIPNLDGRLISQYKIQSQCSKNILNDTENN
jgi:hypothetical protein